MFHVVCNARGPHAFGTKSDRLCGMQQAFGMAVPETVAEMCRPRNTAVLVYDAQVGIFAHVQDRAGLTQRIRAVIDAARAVGAPVIYVRHVSLPPTHLGWRRCAPRWHGSASIGPMR